MATALPNEYNDLNLCLSHPLLNQALNLYGTREFDGVANNPVILDWAKELGSTISQYYRADSIAWCALFMSICAKRAGYKPPEGFDILRARSFAKWGDPIAGEPVLGDILVFSRESGGHVGLYIGEDDKCYHVLGGNQGDCVSIARIPKERLLTSRRAPMNSMPKCVKRIYRSAKGAISINEA